MELPMESGILQGLGEGPINEVDPMSQPCGTIDAFGGQLQSGQPTKGLLIDQYRDRHHSVFVFIWILRNAKALLLHTQSVSQSVSSSSHLAKHAHTHPLTHLRKHRYSITLTHNE